jgi:cell division protein FtsB
MRGSTRREAAAARLERDRAREAERLEDEVEQLMRRRRALKARIQRLSQPLDVPGLVARAEKGEELAQTEWATIAVEDPAAYNDLFEGRKAGAAA